MAAAASYLACVLVFGAVYLTLPHRGWSHTLLSLLLVLVAVGGAGVLVVWRRAGEQSLPKATVEESTVRIRDALDSIGEGVLVVDGSGTVRQTNPAACSLFRYGVGEMDGMRLTSLIPENYRASHGALMAAYVQSPAIRPMGAGRPLVALRNDGSTFAVDIGLSPVVVGDGTYVVAVVRDMSRHRAIEGELKQRSVERAALMRSAVLSREQERRRVARDLHDGIGATLTSLGLFAYRIERNTPDERSRELLTTCRHRLEDAVTQTRQIVQALHPPELDQGLSRAVETLVLLAAENLSGRADFVDTTDGRSVEESVAATVYRVAQEAIANVLKHAGATDLSVILSQRPGILVLVVEDYGQGFETASPGEGFGLASMQERAALVGGDVTVESPPGMGTTVRLEVPVA